jgi:hypothetical protein
MNNEKTNRFGPKRLQPHAGYINSKHILEYAISDLVKEFCEHHDIYSNQIEIVVTPVGCYTKINL